MHTALNIQTRVIYEELYSAHIDQTPCLRAVERWCKRFRKGQEELEDKARLVQRPRSSGKDQLVLLSHRLCLTYSHNNRMNRTVTMMLLQDTHYTHFILPLVKIYYKLDILLMNISRRDKDGQHLIIIAVEHDNRKRHFLILHLMNYYIKIIT
ncbi:unnamed protein product [Didymodactylos carnosus]|uniref:Mos1 transposase HTH domain-containing protein n=1 Tax=Didymodactylos carnosus TaxID=1234261 RepID=A0A814Q898_9BILA|nr:unnamed protein product [Didymodactylos carnosus]CAF3879314.1 unnamed protein product [Didymodactylos carnosus]